MENGFLNGLKCILRGKDFNERGVNPSLILFPRRCFRRQFKPLAFSTPPPPLRKQSLLVQPFLYIYFVVFSIWQCFVYDSTFIYIYDCNTVKVKK